MRYFSATPRPCAILSQNRPDWVASVGYISSLTGPVMVGSQPWGSLRKPDRPSGTPLGGSLTGIC